MLNIFPLRIGLEAPEKSHFKLSIHLIVELNISSRGGSTDIRRRVSMFKCTLTFWDLKDKPSYEVKCTRYEFSNFFGQGCIVT